MVSRNEMGKILDISLPAVAEATVYTLMTIFDIMIIGNYGGSRAVNIAGISNEILVTCTNVFITIGVAIAITSFVSRSIGKRDLKEAEEYASIGFFLGIILSIIISYILFAFSKEILIISGVKKSLIALSNSYTRIVIISIFFNMIINVINSILRGYGNTYTPFLISVVVTLIKLLLDLIFIFVFNTGLLGAAWASVVAQFTGFFIVFLYVINKSYVKINIKHILNLKVKTLKNLVFLSVPSSMEEAAFSVSKLLCVFIIMRAGSCAFASNEIANTVESISFMPGIGFGIAATTLVGMKVGEKNIKKAKEYNYACTLCAVIVMCMFSIVFLLIPNVLVNLFVSKDELEVVALASTCLFVGAFEQPSIAISTVFSGSLKGAGDSKSPFIVSFISSWFIRLPLIFYFIRILKYSVICVWWITCIQWTIDAILMIIFFEKKMK